MPSTALANGLWIGAVPKVLQELNWIERMLVARVRHNYCIVKVKMGAKALRANAISYSIPMPRVYSVLPPKREELNDVHVHWYITAREGTV